MKHQGPFHFLLGIGFAMPIACAPASSGGEAKHAEAPPHSHGEHSHAGEPQAPTGSPGPGSETPGPSGAHHEDHDRAAEEHAAYEKAKPVFAAYCGSCHTTSGGKASRKALSHFKMDTYPFGGHHAAEITGAIREVLGATGSRPTMPRDKPGAVKGEELRLVLAWADAYDRRHSDAGAAGEHAMPDGTKMHGHHHGGDHAEHD